MTFEHPGRRTVLVVDDEPQVVEALTDLLEDEYRVVTETSSATALRMIETDRTISVLLCDQRMPKMTGDQLLAHAREVSSATRLLITGYADLQAVVRAVNDGQIFGYISKPWDPDALRIMVHKAVEHHDLNQELEHERALLRDLMMHSPDGIVLKDRERRYLRLNMAAARFLGIDSPEDAIGKRAQDLLPQERAAQRIDVENRIFATGEPVLDIEERVQGAEGKVAWYASSVAPVRDARQEIVSLIGITRDITARKEMEGQLLQARKMEAIGQLTGGIAHDFNNILGVIIGNLDLLSEQLPGDANLAPLAGAALDAALRGSELTKRLLAFARRQDLKPELIDIRQKLDDVVKLMTRTLGEHIAVKAHVGSDVWPIEADPMQLENAIVNLAVNARDAMPAGGALIIEAENAVLDDTYRAVRTEIPPGRYVRVSVSDTGLGIPPEILDRVCEPFFTTKAIGQGTGLGLSLVHGFVRQSDGHMTIYSAPGRGTTVRLYLPCATSSRVEPQSAPTKEALPRGCGERILVVEDNAPMRSVVVLMLVALGYQVLEAETAAEALAILDAGETVDLLFSDVVMPGGMTGFDLADVISARHPTIPVMLCSGFTERAGSQQGRRPIGAVDLPLLNKPYRREDLARAVRSALDASR